MRIKNAIIASLFVIAFLFVSNITNAHTNGVIETISMDSDQSERQMSFAINVENTAVLLLQDQNGNIVWSRAVETGIISISTKQLDGRYKLILKEVGAQDDVQSILVH